MKMHLTAQEIADLALATMPTTKRRVNSYVERSGWLNYPKMIQSETAIGGTIYRYHIDLLPLAARLDYLRRSVDVSGADTALEDIANNQPHLTGPARYTAAARLALVRIADTHRQQSGLSQVAADKAISNLFNAGSMDVSDWISEQVQSLSARSLARWRSDLKKGNAVAVKSTGPSRKGTGVLDRAEDGQVKTYILALIAKNPHLTAKPIRAAALDKFGEVVQLINAQTGEITEKAMPPLRTFQNAIKAWRAEYKNELVFLTDPDGFKNKVRFTANGSTRADRLNQVWQIDASPADVLTTDGRYTIYCAVDVYSRRKQILVSKTPRAAAVGLMIRKCLVKWGVPEVIKSDNGADFIAHKIVRLLESLGIEQDLCTPFTPEEKGIVERAIGTYQRGCAATLPGFIGHSVSDRKVIEARKAFSKRLGEKDDSLFQVELTAAELQEYSDRWCNDVYDHETHSSLKGKSPFMRAAEYKGDIRRIEDGGVLDILLAEVPGKDGIRTVTRHGIRINHEFYMPGVSQPGDRVLCRMDPADLGWLYLFSPDGETFIERAACPDLAGLNPVETQALVKQAQKAYLQDRTKDIRAEMHQIGPRDVANAVMGRPDADIVPFPKPETPHTTPAIDAARAATGRAAQPEPTPESNARDAALVRQSVAVIEDLNARRTEEQTDKQKQALRLDRARRIDTALEAGDVVSERDLAWFETYETTAEWKSAKGMQEFFGQGA